MSIGWYSLSDIAAKLREYATILSAGAFVDAPNILNSIATRIERGEANEQVLKTTLAKLRESIWREFCDESWKKPILDQVDGILVKGSPSFATALSMLEETKGPIETCIQIMKLAATQTNTLIRMHLYCYIYLVLVEGAYDQELRFLYAIYTKSPSSNAEIRSIVDNFKAANIASALIDGWNPTVRNAIGHATYSLDANRDVATFEDRRAHNSVSLSFTDFSLLVHKVLHVGIAVSTILISTIMVFVAFDEALKVLKKR
jgi:hypothetical protein